MNLTIDPEDEAGFERTTTELLARFGRSPGHQLDDEHTARTALEWKWGYGDGDLGSWALAQIDELLLEWYPRKVTMAPAECAPTIEELRRFFAFLGRERLLGRRSAPAAAIDTHLLGRVAEFERAMGDRSRFGMGKSVLTAMADRGIEPDPEDPESLREVMEAFNSLPFEVRGEILGSFGMGAGFGGPRTRPWAQLTVGIDLPPAPAADAARVRHLATATPALAVIDVLRGFFGEGGRKLTATGNVTLADAKALVALLAAVPGSGVREPEFPIRSAGQLGSLQFVLRWARAAGALRSAHGRVSATKGWPARAEAAYLKALDALLGRKAGTGPMRMYFGEGGFWVPGALAEVLDEGVPHWLATLYALGGEGLACPEMADVSFDACSSMLRWPAYMGPDAVQRRVDSAVATLVNVLAMVGVVTEETREPASRAPASEAPSEGGAGTKRHEAREVREDVHVVVTELGRRALVPYLARHGFDVPVVGALRGEPLVAIFTKVGEWHRERIEAEFVLWCSDRSPEAIAGELAGAMASSDEPEWRVAMLELMSLLDDPVAEAVMGELLHTDLRGFALTWMHERGMPGIQEAPGDGDALMLAAMQVITVTLRHDEGGPGAPSNEAVELVSAIPDLSALVERLWRVPSGWVAELLDLIGRIHPDKAMAKGARKAAFKHRNEAHQARPR